MKQTTCNKPINFPISNPSSGDDLASVSLSFSLAGAQPQHSLESNFEILIAQRIENGIQSGV